MPSPVTPSQLKAALASATGSFCNRFASLFKFPQLFYSILNYERDERGDITNEFCADIQLCIASGTTPGGPGGTPGDNTLAAPVVAASDGAFTDHVVVTWTAPSGATRYEVWRGLTANIADAAKLSDVNAVTTYSDATAVPGTVYQYFVRAFADSPPASSGYSVPDSGYAGSLVPTLSGATDVVATKGVFSHALGAVISVVWSKVSNAQTYDVYRNTTDDYTTATRVAQERTPYVFSDLNPFSYGSGPQMVDNGDGTICYQDPISNSDTDSRAWTNYYYWVVPKRSAPAAVGPFSNSNAGALGWAMGQGQGFTPYQVLPYLLTSGGSSQAVVSGASKVWVGVFGGKAGGAGGDLSKGGGGGGAGAIVTGLMTVAAAGKFRVVSVPEADPAAAGTATNGTDGPVTKLQYSADGLFDDTIDVVTCAAPGGGVYAAGGSGAGGAGATAAVHASLTPANIYAGQAGFAAAASSAGGDSGYLFGYFKGPTNVQRQFDHPGNATTTHAGGGSNANPQGAILALGATGLRGVAFLLFYA